MTKNIRNLIIANCILSVCVLIAVVIMGFNVVNSNSRMTKLEDTRNMSMEEIYTDFEKITSKDVISKTQGIISSSMSKLIYGNYYINIVNPADQSTYAILMTNKDGESIYSATDGNTVVYMKDNNTVQFSEQIYYGMDINIIQQAYLAAQLLGTDKVELLKCRDEKQEDGSVYSEWLMDIKGWDNIQAVYEQVDYQMALDLVNSTKIGLTDDVGTGADVENTNIRYSLVFDKDNNLIACSNYYYFGADNDGSWINCYPSWAFEDMVELHEWKLDQGWYDFDYSKLSDNGEEIEKLMSDLNSEMNTMIKAIADEQGMSVTVPSIDVDVDGNAIENENNENNENELPELRETTDADGNTVYVNPDTGEVIDNKVKISEN